MENIKNFCGENKKSCNIISIIIFVIAIVMIIAGIQGVRTVDSNRPEYGLSIASIALGSIMVIGVILGAIFVNMK